MSTLIPVVDGNAGPYWIDDIPQPITMTFEDSYTLETITLGDDATATAQLRTVGISGYTTLETSIDGDEMTVTFPGAFAGFPVSGVYDIEVRLTLSDGIRNAEPYSLVVQASDGWLTLTQARKGWVDAPDDDVLLYGLLASARVACLSYAPALPLDDDGDVILPLPAGYTQAQLMQARNTWNATKTDPATTGDDQMFVIRPYPLDNFIRQLLRPRRGLPAVG